jgi:hypothetical protein
MDERILLEMPLGEFKISMNKAVKRHQFSVLEKAIGNVECMNLLFAATPSACSSKFTQFF